VPIGFVTIPLSSVLEVGLIIPRLGYSSDAGNAAYGSSVVNNRVWLSTISIDFICVTVFTGGFISIALSMDHFTTSAVNSVPS
jgi:hypothetical protein